LCEDAGVVMAHAPWVRGGDGLFHPTAYARSGWSDDMVNGPALVGLAALSMEHDDADGTVTGGFMPARFTADLFRPAHRVPTSVRTRLVRDGRRIRITECDILQDGSVVARATTLQYRRSEPPPGREWVVSDNAFTPPAGVVATGAAYFVGSDDAGWGGSVGMGDGVDAHQNPSRKRVYHRAAELVAGAAASPFVRAVVAAEAASLVTNLGTAGIGYINGDLTVALSRLPVGDYIGVQADSHWCADGVSVGSATLFDDRGPFGIGMVTAIANPAAQIDFGRLKSGPTLQV
jgi:hypothetical protein